MNSRPFLLREYGAGDSVYIMSVWNKKMSWRVVIFVSLAAGCLIMLGEIFLLS